MLCINQGWIPYLLGAIEVLTIPELWSSDGYLRNIDLLYKELVGTSYVLCSQVQFDACTVSDFTVDDYDWVQAFPYVAHREGGVGWVSDNMSNLDQVYITRSFGGSYRLVRIEMELSDSISPNAAVFMCPGASTPTCSPSPYNTAAAALQVWTGDVTVSQVCVGAERSDADTSAWGAIKRVRLFFRGTAPAIGTGCT